MNRMKKTALAAALLCSAGLAFAQDLNPSWYIQPSANAFKPDQDFGVSERDYGGGLKIGKPLSEMWDVQIGATHARAEEGRYNYRQTLLGADALLMLSRQNFRPFLLIGVGAQRDRVDNPLRRVSKTSPYATAGIGFQLGMTDQWSMQADLRTVRGRLRDDAAFGFGRNNNKYLTIGLNYAFSKPTPPAPPPAPTPPPAVTPPPEPVAPPPPAPARFEKITLTATELFAFNSATLNVTQTRLDEIAAALQADPSITDVDITGYADRLGSEQYNLKLSERRANAVRDYLVAKGIDGARLKAYGKGEANPLVTCTDKRRADLIKCLEPNRRVEVEQITIERRVQ
ncbi:flagellar motor protein MotB [Massilia violaceinigra]|uniref:Flagellar motor protein MotB n=2 Tax=Massilia violaceinigra TaxID=2045208 RepID=A0A2D2DT94_9BURK|nr:OmpA family protein [Massilia violaceinigra]ATQ78195.1 flagellar motor protein MotB [Massilia violaceinigra]